jgi:Amt family ammonium transporter
MQVDGVDVAWVLIATALVWLMLLPGLALFYGGLVQAKNLLSVLAQVLGIGAVTVLVWVGWGYSLAFSEGSAVVGGLSKAGLAGIGPDQAWPLATAGKAIPELLFACFQMTFAAVATALVIGALVERVRFSACSPLRCCS